jgi:SpoVK/Ycf46/Vps4 family AAA+-type ATPase
MNDLDQANSHVKKGTASRSCGNPDRARREFLLAAESLFRAAKQANGKLRDERVNQAERLVKLAGELQESPDKRQATRPVMVGENHSAEADEWLVSTIPTVRFDDVAGLEEVKRQIHLKFIYPFSHRTEAERYRIRSGGGILLYGPPGTGKTLIARAVAGEIDAAFFHVRSSDIMSRWVGAAEQNVNLLFTAARSHARSVIFIDEIESLLPKRRRTNSSVMARVVSQFLSELEGFEENRTPILFIGATNEPWSLDAAALRPGRFDERILVPLPEQSARVQILEQALDGIPKVDDLDIEEVAGRLVGYSGADISNICRKAIEIPFLEAVRTGESRDIADADFETVLLAVTPSVSLKNISRYESFTFA